MALLRWLTAILVVAAVLPASALGDIVVDRDDDTGIITITELNRAIEIAITVSTGGANHVISDPSGLSVRNAA